jgi:hypothetical protein
MNFHSFPFLVYLTLRNLRPCCSVIDDTWLWKFTITFRVNHFNRTAKILFYGEDQKQLSDLNATLIVPRNATNSEAHVLCYKHDVFMLRRRILTSSTPSIGNSASCRLIVAHGRHRVRVYTDAVSGARGHNSGMTATYLQCTSHKHKITKSISYKLCENDRQTDGQTCEQPIRPTERNTFMMYVQKKSI